MKTLLESMNIAFSMYSRIPMPRVDWNEKNMKFNKKDRYLYEVEIPDDNGSNYIDWYGYFPPE